LPRYKRTETINCANEYMEKTGNIYFLTVDLVAYMRDKTGKTKNATEVVQTLLHRKIIQKTGVTVRRSGAEFHVLKRYGAPDPPDDWTYGRSGA
jgi:hypothetical protein